MFYDSVGSDKSPLNLHHGWVFTTSLTTARCICFTIHVTANVLWPIISAIFAYNEIIFENLNYSLELGMAVNMAIWVKAFNKVNNPARTSTFQNCCHNDNIQGKFASMIF